MEFHLGMLDSGHLRAPLVVPVKALLPVLLDLSTLDKSLDLTLDSIY